MVAVTGNLGNWAYLWLWENHAVGNFAATVALGAVGLPKLVKEWRQHKTELHRKLDHIIYHHPDIPELPDGTQNPR